MSTSPVLVAFGLDLRLTAHPALSAATTNGSPVIPVFVLDDISAAAWKPGGASRWWLHGSLTALDASLRKSGSRLTLRRGGIAAELLRLAAETGAHTVHITRRYEPWAIALEISLERALTAKGISLRRFGGTLLFEPETVCTKTGEPYRVFTPFWRAAQSGEPPRAPRPAPSKLQAPDAWPGSDRLADWGLRPSAPDWAGGLRDSWTPGEAGAQTALEGFLQTTVRTYKDDRDRPGRPGTSRLSPHLHFGEISPATIWHAARLAGPDEVGTVKFLAEIGWREFSYQLLTQFPELPTQPFRPEFAAFPWRDDAVALKAWQRGATGYPLVDAGMRQLRATGWMHNRVRMVVASFLVKHLRIGWQRGAQWFWDNLVDADLAANSASWQWVAGCGADAAPYFRIFNPVLQGVKFDPDGAYVRQWVPELAGIPSAYIHAPWEAPALELAAAGVTLGRDYPAPIVDHAEARDAALAALKQMGGR